MAHHNTHQELKISSILKDVLEVESYYYVDNNGINYTSDEEKEIARKHYIAGGEFLRMTLHYSLEE